MLQTTKKPGLLMEQTGLEFGGIGTRLSPSEQHGIIER